MDDAAHRSSACCNACGYAELLAQDPSLEAPAHGEASLGGARLAISVSRGRGAIEREVEFVLGDGATKASPLGSGPSSGGAARARVTVGRASGCDLVLADPTVSRRTCVFFRRDGRLHVEDLHSSCGTYINGRAIHEATPLRPGDRVYVGDFVLAVSTR